MSFFTKLAAEWPALNPLLDQALDLPAEQRSAWLANLPHEHSSLRIALRRLLADPPPSSPEPFPPPQHSEALEPAPAETIGPWRLMRKIGEGGMASVWMAERRDGLLARPVALKLPRRGSNNDLFCQRLARERDFLYALNHPNIARLLDAGVTSHNQPYLVLEYVEGKRIDEYCRDHELSTHARLEVFLPVVRAIAFAHRALVLHRDLKPSNIMITTEGSVRVLDFGVAKLLDRGETEETELTLFAGRAFTAGYASPEQITGQPLTVASDVYSLGVVLYELLTGARPYKLRCRSLAALEEEILETEPPPPSNVVVDKQLRRVLRGDLDRVILTALKKVPDERYPTVDAFAEDIQRYLQRRPVLARPNRPLYRTLMFIRRHRLAFITGMLLLSILVTASALVGWQARIALAQRRRADETKSLIINMLFDAHSYRGVGKPAPSLEFLRQTQQRLAALPTSDVKTRVQILNVLSAGLLSQQDTKGAEAANNQATQEADILGPWDPQKLRSRLFRSWVLFFRGQTDKICPEVDLLLKDMRQYGSALPEDFAGAWRIRSAIAAQQGDFSKAISAALEALRIAESHPALCRNQAVLAMVDLCTAYQCAGQKELAVKTGDLAVKRALDTYSQSTTHPNVLKARVAFYGALARSGQAGRAIHLTQAAIQDASALFGPSCRLVGLELKELAEIQMEAGQWRAARQSIEQSRSILSGHYQHDSPAYAALLKLRSEIGLRAADLDAKIH
jgi:eukaryotic-like serine/threonine-protein kinase